MANWGYAKVNGPHTWANVAPDAKGKRQSPIDIRPSQAKYDENLHHEKNPLVAKYDPSHASDLVNNSKTIMMNIAGKNSTLKGGPIEHEYEAVQLHFHWGSDDSRGSEHTVDGHMYAAELHIVHYNRELFKSFGDAAKEDKGLCVLGVFLKVGSEHEGIKKMTDLYPKANNAGDTVTITDGFDPACLLPEDTTKYWTYLGSLTTPPCFESVTWVVFKDPIEVSREQMEAFRGLRTVKKDDPVPSDELKGQMIDNYRPPLPLGERTLRASFQ